MTIKLSGSLFDNNDDVITAVDHSLEVQDFHERVIRVFN